MAKVGRAPHSCKRNRGWLSRVVATVTATIVSFTLAMPSHAQGRVAVVRDAEIETLLKDYASPIFKAAGLKTSRVQIVLVNDPAFNAFVDGQRMFINTGALADSTVPNEIIGVIAHEAGHLAGGHQQRLREQIAAARTLAIVGGLFVLETVSVIVQVISFKLTGRRVFRMAPLHHHFEQKGWAEATIVIRFWIIASILALAGLATLKLR